MNAWSNLTNAHHIDWVLQSVKDNPREWNRAWNAERYAAMGAARGRAYNAAWDAGKAAVYYAARGAARIAARGAILALVAYDNSAKYLDMTYEELKVWATISEEPASILLLPMVKARELIEAKNEQALV